MNIAAPLPNPMTSRFNKNEEARATARRRSVKAFRGFLDALEMELALYGFGANEHELSGLCFRYIRKAARVFRDEPGRIHEITVMTILDLAAAWDEWVVRQKLPPEAESFHQALVGAIRRALKTWRTYRVRIQLADSPAATPELHGKENDHGEIRSLDERVHLDQRDES